MLVRAAARFPRTASAAENRTAVTTVGALLGLGSTARSTAITALRLSEHAAVCAGASGVVLIADGGAATRTGAVMPPWRRARTVARSGPSCCGIVLDLGANTPAGSLLDSALASNRLVAVVIPGHLDASASKEVADDPARKTVLVTGAGRLRRPCLAYNPTSKIWGLPPDQSRRDRHCPMLVGHGHLTPAPRSPIARSAGIWKSTHTSTGSPPYLPPGAASPATSQAPASSQETMRAASIAIRAPQVLAAPDPAGGRDLVQISWVDHRRHAVSLRWVTLVRTCRYAVR